MYCPEDTFQEFAMTPQFLEFIKAFDLQLDFTKQFKGDNEVVKKMLRLHAKDWPGNEKVI